MSPETLLSDAAEILRIPVMVLIAAALAATGWELGRFAVELARRRRMRLVAPRALDAAVAAGALPSAGAAALPSAPAAGAAAALFAARGDADRHEAALAAFELAAQRRLEPTRMLVRVGPALGLMGTLIPLAPGLAAVGEGDVATLGAELQTAFAATVLGLAVGTVGFVVTLVRQRIYAEDLHGLERLAARLRERAWPA